MVAVLIAEWTSASNRFEAPGEAFYGACFGAQTVGVCGLNVDPFAGAPEIGRVRRLFVSPAHRRQGIGSLLVDRVIADAAGRFELLHVRTYDPVADVFYRSQGFTPVNGDQHCTHRLELIPGEA